MNSPSHSNKLIHETSPYLLQHAHNPVDWYPWGKEALNKAKEEDKPVLVSIGYSACHWCHVMERESFEQEAIAAVMNKNFICIKVDREERPDVDQIYMDAVQSMGLQGGWPLNVFITPDQKPFYGGTYFPPQHWAQLLQNVAQAFVNNRGELENSADQFTAALSMSEVKKYGLEESTTDLSDQDMAEIYQKFAQNFDQVKGGTKKAPKFPMPVNWLFLLHYFAFTNNENAKKQTDLTLKEMAYGGIYDQIGGGFARYSVDADWLVPHFEKMLYDNGQLVSLYSEACQLTKSEMYKDIVYQTIGFVAREMTHQEGGFYSALDADSEGEEGKFYIWTKDEIENIVGEESSLIMEYYNVHPQGNWEDKKNILHVKESAEAFAKKYDLNETDFKEILQQSNIKLLKARNSRIRPGLDDKILTAWNGIMLKGLTDAYAVFGEKKFLDLALKNAGFIEKNLRNGDQLWRSYKNGKSSLEGYLDDYAFVIQAYTGLYQVTFDEKWLYEAKKLTQYAIKNFYDEKEELFFYTDNNSEKLIARKKEIFDNVIPGSNSVMAENLHFLGLLLDSRTFGNISKKMVQKISKLVKMEPGYLANWTGLFTFLIKPTAEIAIVGPEAEQLRKKIEQRYYPNKVIMGTLESSDLPLLEDKVAVDGKTTIYVCYNKTCQLPVHEVEKAFELMQ